MMHIINYSVRILIIIIGILFLSGFITPANGDTTLYNVMGIIFILFGTYRIALYRMKTKQYNFMLNNDDENDDSEDKNNNSNDENNEEKSKDL
jgi:Ca2+/H+ antiporter